MPITPKGKIPIDYATLRAGYPTYNRLPKHIADYMASLNKGIAEGQPKNTPCCFQVSEALNNAGAEHLVGPRSHRRPNSRLGTNYYLGAVDELEHYLAGRYGKGEEVQLVVKTAANRTKEMKAAITGRKGIICFRNGGAGAHTELWDGTDIVQNGAPAADGAALSGAYIWGQPRIVFWEVSGEDNVEPAPAWLQGWWDVNDGIQYYYYFSDQYVVHWTKTEPGNAYTPPGRNAMNEGSYEVTNHPGEIVITWNPSGDGITTETFAFSGYQPTAMTGRSNRFGALTATRKVTWKK
jgi:hypothetical protein